MATVLLSALREAALLLVLFALPPLVAAAAAGLIVELLWPGRLRGAARGLLSGLCGGGVLLVVAPWLFPHLQHFFLKILTLLPQLRGG